MGPTVGPGIVHTEVAPGRVRLTVAVAVKALRRAWSRLTRGSRDHSDVPTASAVPFDDQAAAIVHQTYVGVWDREADRFWVRNNLLLLVNGALLSIAATADVPRGLRLVLCGFGVYFSLHWVLINAKGGHYVSRWRPAIEAYEASLSKRPIFQGMPLSTVRPDSEVFAGPVSLGQHLKVLRGACAPRRETGQLMHAIIVGFVLAWASLGLFYSVYDTKMHAENVMDQCPARARPGPQRWAPDVGSGPHRQKPPNDVQRRRRIRRGNA